MSWKPKPRLMAKSRASAGTRASTVEYVSDIDLFCRPVSVNERTVRLSVFTMLVQTFLRGSFHTPLQKYP